MAIKYNSKLKSRNELLNEVRLKEMASDTRVYELDSDIDDELPLYPYCKLPAHYFDLLLHKKTVAASVTASAQLIKYNELR